MTPIEPQPKRGRGRPSDETPWGWVRMYAVVLEFLAYLGGFGYLGYHLDEHRGWQPWGLLAGLSFGTAFGLYRLIREANKLEKEDR